MKDYFWLIVFPALFGIGFIVGIGVMARNAVLDSRADAYCQGLGFQGGRYLREGDAECYTTQSHYKDFALPPSAHN